MPHPPLSQRLARILEGSSKGGITLNRLLERTEGRGVYLVIILLCVPFLVPVSIPGTSTVLGAVIALLVLPMAFGRRPRLPNFLGEHVIPPVFEQKILGGGIKFLRLIERMVRPRRSPWMTWPVARFGHGLLIFMLALALMLPLPAPPFFFSNSVPCYAIILLAASMMEEDGVLIWVSYAAVLGTVIFFALLGGAVIEVVQRLWEATRHFLGIP